MALFRQALSLYARTTIIQDNNGTSGLQFIKYVLLQINLCSFYSRANKEILYW